MAPARSSSSSVALNPSASSREGVEEFYTSCVAMNVGTRNPMITLMCQLQARFVRTSFLLIDREVLAMP
jgi:hypothetical protein